MRGKIHVQKRGGKRQKIKIRYVAAAMAMALGAVIWPQTSTRAEGCPDLRLVFARGSGGERWNDQNYLAFKAGLESKLYDTGLNYEFIDLDYPAVGIGIGRLDVLIGAAVGSGEAYEFGESVNTGVDNLKKMVNSSACVNTKYVLGGYSQGAMVVSKALKFLKADKIIYAATFGDPKLYLPEGQGLFPAACRGGELSDYRMYVPDCRAYKGLLGAYTPYEPAGFAGKVGTWCNKRDIFCSSYLTISDHTAYVKDNLYEDASKTIFDKITKTFRVANTFTSPHDTAILIDSTWSMSSLLDQYKGEALRLATETLNSGGRVALFDYRDLDDPYDLVQHCGFEDCTLEKFKQELSGILVGGGGDSWEESMLSASFHAMRALNWKQGSTKSLVVLTDANFVSPDRDGITLDDVVRLSKRIDPVNFYIITEGMTAEYYEELAKATDGKVVTDVDRLDLLTDDIMARYDSLPRVDEEMLAPTELPTLEVADVTKTTGSTMDATVKFTNTGTLAMVILNDVILGVTADTEVTITGLDVSQPNTVTLVPMSNEVRGEAVTVTLGEDDSEDSGGETLSSSGTSDTSATSITPVTPVTPTANLAAPETLSAPATGRR